MDGYLSPQTVSEVKATLASPEKCNAMVHHNYALAKQHFSYNILRRQLEFILESFSSQPIGFETIQPKEISNIVYLNNQSAYRYNARLDNL